MALLGSSIDPSLFRQDYSGFVNAANTNANAIAGLGQTIAGGIERYGEEKQNRKKLDASIKASVTGIESAIKMGKSLGIDIESSLSPYLQKINDPNISPIEAAAYAKEASNSISNVLNFGMEGRKFDTEQNRLDQQATLQMNQLIADQKAAMRAESRKAPTTQKFGVQGGEQDMVWNADTQSWEKPRISGGLVDIVKSFEGFNPNAYSDYKQTSVGYGTRGKEGEVLTESQATERLNTELSVHAKRIKDAAELKGVSLNENQFNALASFDFNTGQGVGLIERFGDKPNELVAKMQEYTKAGGEDLPGLVNRRRMESALFLTPVESSVGFTPNKPQEAVKIVTGEEAKALGLKPENTYEAKFVNGEPTGYTVLDKAAIPTADAEKANEASLRAASDAAYAIKTVNELTSSPGFSDVFGVGIGLKHVPGTAGFDADVSRKAIVALATTDSMRKFQGLGSMSDAEFSVARSAATQISEGGISETKAAEELNRLRNYFSTSIKRAEELGRIPKGTSDKMISEAMAGINKTSDGKIKNPLNSTEQLRMKLGY